jgi:excisionase family DNA binding protein
MREAPEPKMDANDQEEMAQEQANKLEGLKVAIELAMLDLPKVLTWSTAPETLKVSEAAQLARLHINTIRSAIHDNRLPATKPTGSHWRIQKDDLFIFAKGRTTAWPISTMS